MKNLKAAAVFVFSALFIFACTSANNTNVTVNTNTKVTVNQNGTTATYDAVPSNTTNTAAPDELAGAREIFMNNCVGCHKQNGEGGEGLFQGKKVKVPNYKSNGAMNASDEKLADYITNGEEDEMPAFKDKLKPEEIKALVKFIRKEFQGK